MSKATASLYGDTVWDITRWDLKLGTKTVYNYGNMAQEIISHPPSTNIAQIVYDRDTQTLTISFLKGGVCEYYEVDETSAHGFEQALSATKYMNGFIENVFPSQRIV